MTSGRPGSALGRNRTARVLLPFFLVVFVALTWWRLRGTTPEFNTLEFSGPTMGTSYSVKVVAGTLTTEETRVVSARIESELDRVNELMSTYRPDSELSRFNQAPGGAPFAVSPETAEVFAVARRVSEHSDGAFDVTVGPLVALWGFGATDRAPQPPTPDELAAAREVVGYRMVTVDTLAHTVTKEKDGTRCDLSAIAKGFGVDRVATGLEELGYERFLVEVGGEIAARGRRADGSPWRVAIEQPDPDRRSVYRVVDLDDAAMATSGDYRNYYQADGVWLSHIIDPRTEHPISHDLASVSVVHDQCMWADAWATALSVLGPDQGMRTAEAEGLAVHFLVRDGHGGFEARASSKFRARFGDPVPAP